MKEKDKKDLTIEHMYGNWKFKDDMNEIQVSILNTPKVVRINYNGKTEELNNSGHWFGDYHFCFNHQYYVRFADENRLIFGKHKSSVIGDYEWEFLLSRL